MYPCVNIHQVLQPEEESGSDHNLSSTFFFPWEFSPSGPSASGFSLQISRDPTGSGSCVQGRLLSPHLCGYYSSHHSLGSAEEHRQERNKAT